MLNPNVALVTGAGRGIGLAIARVLAQDGYALALLARSQEELKSAKQSLESEFKVPVSIFATDVSDEVIVEKAVAEIEETLGKVIVLVNNAGLYEAGSWESNYEQFDRIMQVNMRGPFNLVKAIAPGMKQQKRGHIFNISSVCGKHGFADVANYCASKFALSGFSEALFREMLPFNVKVTSICPSWVDTKMARGNQACPEVVIAPDDIAKSIRFVMSLSAGAAIKELVVECASAPC